MPTSTTVRVTSDPVAVLGPAERFGKILRDALGVAITVRHQELELQGEPDAVAAAAGVVGALDDAAARSTPMGVPELLQRVADHAASIEAARTRAALAAPDTPTHPAQNVTRNATWRGDLDVYAAGKRLRARSENQQRYLDAIRSNDLVFAIGPAGTGKTYLAVAAAVQLLKEDRVRKLMLVRPAVEAGERLGFLPGGIEDKVNPYLRPLLDALHDMMDYHTVRRFMETDVVEICPLAFMRGRTLNHAVVILDEAQNTTTNQMQMFLTRLGEGSKMVVTGDVTQIDLPAGTPSGLIDAARRLRRVKGVAFAPLEKQDVVRHPLVQRIVDAYGDQDRRAEFAGATPSGETPDA